MLKRVNKSNCTTISSKNLSLKSLVALFAYFFCCTRVHYKLKKKNRKYQHSNTKTKQRSTLDDHMQQIERILNDKNIDNECMQQAIMDLYAYVFGEIHSYTKIYSQTVIQHTLCACIWTVCFRAKHFYYILSNKTILKNIPNSMHCFAVYSFYRVIVFFLCMCLCV